MPTINDDLIAIVIVFGGFVIFVQIVKTFVLAGMGRLSRDNSQLNRMLNRIDDNLDISLPAPLKKNASSLKDGIKDILIMNEQLQQNKQNIGVRQVQDVEVSVESSLKVATDLQIKLDMLIKQKMLALQKLKQQQANPVQISKLEDEVKQAEVAKKTIDKTIKIAKKVKKDAQVIEVKAARKVEKREEMASIDLSNLNDTEILLDAISWVMNSTSKIKQNFADPKAFVDPDVLKEWYTGNRTGIGMREIVDQYKNKKVVTYNYAGNITYLKGKMINANIPNQIINQILSYTKKVEIAINQMIKYESLGVSNAKKRFEEWDKIVKDLAIACDNLNIELAKLEKQI